MQNNRKVAMVALLVAAATALCRLGSMGKELFVAYLFGAGPIMDAYSLALLIPSLAAALFLNAVRRAFLTQYPSHQQECSSDKETFANVYLSSLFIVSVVLAFVLSILIRPILPFIVSSNNPEVADYLFHLSIPAVWMIVPLALIYGFTSVLNARKSFSSPQLTNILPPITIVIFVYFLGKEWGPVGILWGLIIGSLFQSGCLLWMLKRSGHQPRFRLKGYSNILRTLWMFSIPIILLEVLVQLNVYIDRAMASALEPGKVSVLYWSAMMKDFISGVLVAPLLMILLPHFSEQVANRAKEELQHSCTLIIRYGAIVFFPISALLILCGPVVLRHLQMGQLSPEASKSIAYCLSLYGLGLFGEFVGAALFQALTALKRIRAMLLLGIFANFLPNIILNLLFINPLGELGLALSTALVAYISMVCVYLAIRKHLNLKKEKKNFLVIGGCFLASVLMVGVGFGVLKFIHLLVPHPFWMDILGASLAGISGIFVYAFLLLKYPGNKDAQHAYQLVREKIRIKLGTI